MRGQIFSLKTPRDAKGHEQKFRRYGVIVQATRFDHLSTWVLVPTSSSPNVLAGPLHPVLDWGAGETRVLTEAVHSVDPAQRLGEPVGFAPLSTMQDIDQALRFLLDLP